MESFSKWQYVALSDQPTFVKQVNQFKDKIKHRLSLEDDIIWLQGKLDSPSKNICLFFQQNSSGITGYSPVFVHPSKLQYYLGEITLFSVSVTRYVLSPCVFSSVSEITQNDYSELLSTVKSHLKGNGVIFFQALATDSLFHKYLINERGYRPLFFLVPHGPLYKRRLINLKGDYTAYLSSLSKKSRQDLNRTRKKFESQFGSNFSVSCITEQSDISQFIKNVNEISCKTYQWHLLGIGIKPGGHVEKQLNFATKQGWCRCYLLTANNKPVAFQIGYSYDQTYFAYDIGYDPEIQKFQPGVFLHTEIIMDLCEQGDSIERFDFLMGDSIHKKRLSNYSHEERHYYLIPRTLRGTIIAIPLITINKLSAIIGNLLERYKLKTLIKSFIRKKSTS